MKPTLIVLETFNNAIDANICKSILAENGIESEILDENISSIYGDAVGQIKLCINEIDKSNAVNVLIESNYLIKIDPDDNLLIDPCRNCGSRKINEKESIPFNILSILLLFIPYVLKINKYNCNNNGISFLASGFSCRSRI